jgi:hypothetical protein
MLGDEPHCCLVAGVLDVHNSLNNKDLAGWHEISKGSFAANRSRPRLEPLMNLLATLLTVMAIGLGLILLLPVVGLGLALALVFGCFFIWLLPILIIAVSDKTTAGEKLAWILAILFLSWFAWIFYFLLAPLKERRRYRYD